MDFILGIVQTYGLYGLFLSIFFAYSVFPSAVAAPILISINFFNPWTVFFVSMVAATLGSITNYYIGLWGIRKFFPNSRAMKRAEKHMDKYGSLALIFLAWIPLIGDPIIIASGVLKVEFWKFMLYTTINKIGYLSAIIFLGIAII